MIRTRTILNFICVLYLTVITFTVLFSAHARSNDLFSPTITFAAGFLNHPNFTPSDKYTVDDDIWITSEDGTIIAANVITPNTGTGPYPAVIFINSWTMNEYEYTLEAQKYASDGYIVLSYSTRGFGDSEGLIDTAGPNDVADFQAVVDWVLENTNADAQNLGAAGISYGSGISLIGAAHDDRIKAVAAMSSWGSLKESLYGNDSPVLVWGQILDYSSVITGRPDPVIHEYYTAMLNQELDRTDELTAWAAPRSPISFVDQLNANGTAVYLSKNWGDDLFHPNSVMDLYTKLTNEKFIDLAPGTHATHELLGMLGFASNRILGNARRWFDYHLKGINTGIQEEKPVQMAVKLSDRIEAFEDFPIPQARTETFYLHPRGFGLAGELETSPFQTWRMKTDRINSYFDTLANTGFPVVSQTVEQFNIPTLAQIPLISRHQGIWFTSDTLRETMKIRGNSHLTLQVEPQQTQAQIVAYLYDMNKLGTGTLITHKPYTLPAVTPGKKISVNFDLVTTAYDIPKGHKLVLVIDTQDLHYGRPPEKYFNIEFKFNGNKQSVLNVPVL